MNLICALLVVLPLALARPNERMLLDTLLQGDELKLLVGQLTSTLGSDATEQACEAECHTLIKQDHLLQFGCPLVCKSLQTLAQKFSSTPTTTGTAAKRAFNPLTSIFQGTELQTLVGQLATTLGSDATEQACEAECHVLIKQDHLLQFGCPLVCKSLQTLVQQFGLSTTTTTGNKRMLLDTLLQGDELKLLVGQLTSTLGSDATEQACEAECHTLIKQDHLLQFGCPLVCKSLQTLAQKFSATPTTTGTAKRAFTNPLTSIFQGGELQTLVGQLFTTLGSDGTEQACEAECHVLIKQDHLLQFGCPLVCKSFQTLVQQFGLAPATTQKRMLLDTLLQGDELKLLVGQLSTTLGSDATEQACEAECHTLIKQDHLLQFGCPLVCKSLQTLVQKFSSTPTTTSVSGTAADTQSKRMLIDTLFQGEELKLLVGQLTSTLGSDATEQACEAECHTLIKQDHLLQFGCPLVCKSLQSLAQKFTSTGTSA